MDTNTLFTDAWNSLYSVINDRNYIPDPIDSTGKRKFVYSRAPYIKEASFAGFPYIILNQPQVVIDTPSVSSNVKQVTHTIQLEVHSSDLSSGGIANGKGQIYQNQITDYLFRTINSLAARQQLKGQDLDNLNISTDSSDVIKLEEFTVFTRTFTISFNSRFKFY